VGIETTEQTSTLQDTRHTTTFVGSLLPSQLNLLYWYISEVTEERYFIKEGQLAENEEIAIVTVLKEDAEAANAKLKSMNFINIDIPAEGDFDGLSVADCEVEIEELKTEDSRIDEAISEFGQKFGFDLVAALEACEIELSRIAVEFKMKRTRDTCILWAWLPDGRKDEFKTAMHSATDGSALVDFKSGQFDPTVTPTYTKNSEFMEPMRGLVSSFGTPSQNEVDPYPFVKFLFPILFGIMFADVGHGFLLFLIGLWAYRKKKSMDEIPSGISGYMYGGAELLIVMGLTSFIIGFPMNSVFGDETLLWSIEPIRTIFEHNTWEFFFKFSYEGTDKEFSTIAACDEDLHHSEFYPGEHCGIERNYVSLLIFSFVMGAIVILLGLVLNLYQLINHRHSDADLYAAATLTGVYVSAILTAVFAVLGISLLTYIFIASIFVNLIATLTIEKRAHGVDGLMLGVDHTISLLSNTFSFGRLLAMNTIHFVLAFLPYLFLDMAFDGVLNHDVDHISWMDTTQLTVIWIIAAILGALIVVPVETVFSTLQSLRLNWVEFFGKFFKGEGVQFKPVKVKRIFTAET
jgi:V/A-type H+-transporting ATPase subunit I